MTIVEQIDPDRLRAAVSTALADGARFSSAWATAERGWRIALNSDGHQTRVLSCKVPPHGVVDSIIELAGAAVWDEREAHDLYALPFAGHEPLRALVRHPAELSAWTTPVRGDGVHQVAVGPIHAGVIESGHFRFHCVGDQILALDTRLFHKHRGLERAAEGHAPQDALAHVARACAACSVANSVAYALAAEDALGLTSGGELARQRTVLLELERTYNHLHDIGAICAGVGFAAGAMGFAALKDRAQELCRAAFGHRFLFGAVAVGDGPCALEGLSLEALRAGLRELRTDATAAWRDLEFAASLQARLDGIGLLDRTAALRLGVVGPAARAAGVAIDARVGHPHLTTAGIEPAALSHPDGDVAARLKIRAAELIVTWDLLDELLSRPLERCRTVASRAPSAIGIGRTESPRGESVCAVELAGGRVARVHLRTGSYANWPAVAAAAAGNQLPDFPLINKSFELCYACADR